MLALLLIGIVSAAPYDQGCDLSDGPFVDTVNHGFEALGAGDVAGAVDAGETAVKRQPRCAAALVLRTQSLLLSADPRSIAVAGDAARVHPDLAAFPTLESSARFAAQDFEGALAAARRARALDPADAGAVYAEITALVRLGRYEEAHASLDGATALPAPDVACQRIAVLADEDRLPEAEALAATCSMAPEGTSRNFALATLAQRRGDLQGAAREAEGFLAAAGLEATAADAFNAGRFADALGLYRQLAEAEPWNAIHRVNLTYCLVQTGDRNRARKELEGLLSAGDWVTVHNTGAFSGIVTRRTEQEFELALQNALSTLIVLLVEEGDAEAAQTAQRRAEARFGRTPVLLASGLAVTRATEGPTAAWVGARQALRSWPESPPVVGAVTRLAFADAAGLDDATLDLLAEHAAGTELVDVAGGLGNARRFPDCATFALRVLPRLDGDLREQARRSGYQCAAQAAQLAGLDSLGEGHPEGLPAWALVRHAELLRDAGRAEEATPLALAAADDPEAGPFALELLGKAAIAEGRLADAVALANRPHAGPVTRFNLGVNLYNGRHFAEAREATRQLDCATFDPAGVAQCRSFLEALATAP